MKKILMINVAAHGHINPTIVVCKELVERIFESEIRKMLASINLTYEKAL